MAYFALQSCPLLGGSKKEGNGKRTVICLEYYGRRRCLTTRNAGKTYKKAKGEKTNFEWKKGSTASGRGNKVKTSKKETLGNSQKKIAIKGGR